MATRAFDSSRQAKWAFFALIAACSLLVIWVDERFLIDAADPEWKHIASFRLPLFFHGLFGVSALALGTAQFSARLRARPGVHRWMGRGYLAAVTASAPFAGWIGVHFEAKEMLVEQFFQASLWALTAWIGWYFMRRRDLARHRLWMMRSYGFCLVFIMSRVPDGWPGFHWTGQLLADSLWSMIVAALVVPDLILAAAKR
jgi:hypothetical protein